MSILVAMEFSGIVRDAFIDLGYDAMSCDLLPSESNKGPHYQGDIRDILDNGWSLMIAHPPCTHLCVSGARHFKYKEQEQKEALEFVKMLLEAPIERICLENPVGIISTKIRKPEQYIQPYEFGTPESKKTGLWLKNLPKLVPTTPNLREEMLKLPKREYMKVHYMSPSENRGKERSRTPIGLAKAMAQQWSILL